MQNRLNVSVISTINGLSKQIEELLSIIAKVEECKRILLEYYKNHKNRMQYKIFFGARIVNRFRRNGGST